MIIQIKNQILSLKRKTNRQSSLFITQININYSKNIMMKNNNKKISDRDKILHGMDKVYEKLIDSKKKTNSDLIVLRDNHIIRIKPE